MKTSRISTEPLKRNSDHYVVLVMQDILSEIKWNDF